VYLGEAVGGIFCVYLSIKHGDPKIISRGAVLSFPFLLSLLLPAYRSMNLDSESFWLSDGFVYSIVLIASVMNGLGMGVSQPAAGNFISNCAVESNKGFYFALFWSCYMGS